MIDACIFMIIPWFVTPHRNIGGRQRATLECSFRDLSAGNTLRPPHLDNLVAIIEDHDRLEAILANLTEHVGLDQMVRSMISMLPHV